MKRALGVIVFAALKARNVAFPKSGKSIFISVWLGKFFKFSKLSPAVVLLFLRHIGCGANALIFGVAHLKKSRSSTVSYPPSNIVPCIVAKISPKSSI